MDIVRRSVGGTLLGLLCLAGPAALAAELPAPDKIVTPTPYLSLSAVHAGGGAQIAVAGDILPGWHVNAHVPSADYLIPTEVRFEPPPGIRVGEARYPEGEMVTFAFAGQPLRVYETRFVIVAPVQVAKDLRPGTEKIAGTLSYQSCTDRVCLPPAKVPFTVELEVAAPGEAVSPRHPELFEGRGGVTGLADPSPAEPGSVQIGGASFLVFLLIYLGGLALNLTPCVYPLIPITIAFFGGQVKRSTLGTFGLASVYVLGMAATYSSLGVAVALTGGLFGAALQNPLVLTLVAAVLVGLALSQFGVYEFRIPGTSRLGSRRGTVGALVMGMVVGLVAAPCIGPFVVVLLATVAREGDPVLGFWKFFILSLGLGTPYLFLGAFSGGLARMPRAGDWMDGVKHLFGLVLLAVAAYFMGQAVPAPAGAYLLPGTLAGSAVWLAFFERRRTAGWFNYSRFGLAGVAILAAAWLVWPDQSEHMVFKPYSASAVRAAREAGRPVLIDFTADWCVPCKEYEQKVFNDPRVIAASAGFVKLQADLTRSVSPELKTLIKTFGVFGPPTILFIDAEGREHPDLRLVGYMGPAGFVEHLKAVGGQAAGAGEASRPGARPAF
ncbi:MAG: cytochrome c biogenesis protein CcdA [Acidobacteriota bacterium]